MKFFCCYTDSHEQMVTDYLRPSVENHFEFHSEKHNQECRLAEYNTEGWCSTIRHKTQMFLDALKTETEPFVMSDADVVCRGFTPEDVLSDLGDYELGATDDGDGNFCAGFMLVKPCQRLVRMAKWTLQVVKYGEQPMMNRIAKGLKIRVKLLPEQRYASLFTIFRTLWDGEDLKCFERLPSTLKVFHANWTVGVARKLKALSIVKQRLL